jgi:hypothetical protein
MTGVDDDRVRCWDCQHWTPTELFCPVRTIDGRLKTEKYKGKTCRHGLGHDPLILRRCVSHRRKRPQHIIPIPRSYQQGWAPT